MALYLGTDGVMGECPDWYTDMQAARYLGVPLFQETLLDAPIWWRDKALIAMTAEAQGQKIKQQRGL